MLKVAFVVLWLLSFATITFPVLVLWRKQLSGQEGVGICALLFISFVAGLIAIIIAILSEAMVPAITMTVTVVTIVLSFLALWSHRFRGWDVVAVSVYYATMFISIIFWLK